MNPAVTFTSPSGSSSGRWYVTTAQNRAQDAEDTIVVYSNVGPPQRHPSRRNTRAGSPVSTTAPIDNRRQATILQGDADVIRSSSSLFPTSGHTDNVPLTVDTDGNPADFEETVRIPGTFHGASGHYRCVGSGGNACSVRHTGRGYVLDNGTWTFRTTSTNPTVKSTTTSSCTLVGGVE